MDGISIGARVWAVYGNWADIFSASVFVGGAFWGNTGGADSEAFMQQQGLCESESFKFGRSRGEHA